VCRATSDRVDGPRSGGTIVGIDDRATAAEIKLLFLEFQSAGVAFHQRLKKQPWGARDFVVRDPDGNLLLFAGPAN